jgi:5-methylcytosine-specific restriction endonuclease McrA
MYRIVAARAGYCCEYCLLPQLAEAMDLTADHIIPKSEGGETEIGNLALACMGCNAHKGTFTQAGPPAAT